MISGGTVCSPLVKGLPGIARMRKKVTVVSRKRVTTPETIRLNA
jgi:hypothetical protein